MNYNPLIVIPNVRNRVVYFVIYEIKTNFMFPNYYRMFFYVEKSL